MKRNPLPSFFVIGAQKAGTTTLHDLLNRDPGVELPSIKETHFFSDDVRNARGMDWYLKWFDNKGPNAVRGEVDPDYLFFPIAAERIACITPEVKIVVVLRNPLERAYSHYRMSVRRGFESLPFDQALVEEPRRMTEGMVQALKHHSYAARGRYAEQIERWKRVLPSGDFLFIRFEDFVKPEIQSVTYGRICDFIGARATLTPEEMNVVSNPASIPKSAYLTRLLWGDSSLKRILKPIVYIFLPKKDTRGRITRKLDKWNQKTATRAYEDWQLTLPAEVFPEFEAEICKAEATTGLDLSDWRSDRHNKATEKEEIH